MSTCSHCGASLPADATFCPSCGRRTDAPLVESPREVPINVQNAEPRYFGLGPPVFVIAVAVALIVAGIALFVTGFFVVAVVAVVLGLCLLPAFLSGARRWPDTPVARIGVSAADRVRDEAGVAAKSISTLSRAGRDLARLRREQFRLRRDRDAKIRELGVSFYADDGRADELKAAAQELDERIAANDRLVQRTLAGARRRVRKERATVVATEVIKPEPATELESASEAAAADEPLTRADAEPETEPKPAAKKRQTRSR